MARELHVSPAEILEWDSLELDLWIEHFSRRPFGDEADDFRTAQLGYYITSSMADSKGKKMLKLKQFIPEYKRTIKEKQNTKLNESINALKMIGKRG